MRSEAEQRGAPLVDVGGPHPVSVQRQPDQKCSLVADVDRRSHRAGPGGSATVASAFQRRAARRIAPGIEPQHSRVGGDRPDHFDDEDFSFRARIGAATHFEFIDPLRVDGQRGAHFALIGVDVRQRHRAHEMQALQAGEAIAGFKRLRKPSELPARDAVGRSAQTTQALQQVDLALDRAGNVANGITRLGNEFDLHFVVDHPIGGEPGGTREHDPGRQGEPGGPDGDMFRGCVGSLHRTQRRVHKKVLGLALSSAGNAPNASSG